MNKTALVAQLIVDEGKRQRIYVDTVGKVTGGVGRNLSDRPFSDDEIMLMLNNDITGVERDLDTYLPWWRQLSEVRQNVFANLCFNVGILRLLGFQLMLAAAKSGDYEKASMEMMNSTWAHQVGNRAVRLSNAMKNDIL